MVKKEAILAKLLVDSGDVEKYVILKEDITGRYIRYAFIDGYPHDCYNLPIWSKELKADEIYEISGYTTDHWCFKDSKPVDVNQLMNKKFELSTNEIEELIK